MRSAYSKQNRNGCCECGCTVHWLNSGSNSNPTERLPNQLHCLDLSAFPVFPGFPAVFCWIWRAVCSITLLALYSAKNTSWSSNTSTKNLYLETLRDTAFFKHVKNRCVVRVIDTKGDKNNSSNNNNSQHCYSSTVRTDRWKAEQTLKIKREGQYTESTRTPHTWHKSGHLK